jgi:hypothetical protein
MTESERDRIKALEVRMEQYGKALHEIEDAPDHLIEVVWDNLPSPYEIDVECKASAKRLLRAIAAATNRSLEE